MASKRPQTMAKIAREREVKERRARKLEKKRAAAAERKAKAEGGAAPSSEPAEVSFHVAAQPRAVDV